MPPIDLLITFLVSAALFAFIPGPAMLYAAARTLAGGRKAGLMAAFGVHVGGYAHVLAAATGLSVLFHAVPALYMAVKLAGAVYLIVMGWRLATGHAAESAESRELQGPRRAFAQSVLVEVLNPKTAIFFLAFLPQFVAADDRHPLGRMLELSAAFMAMTFAVFAVYGLFAAAVRDRVITRPKVMTWLRRSFAAGFAALGARLALAER